MTIVSFVIASALAGKKTDGSFYPDSKGPIKNFNGLESPFRMQKMNLLWEKTRTKLTENKLSRLYSELKLLDKDEITLKRLKSEGGDKEGIKEAELRKRFNAILDMYGVGAGQERIRQEANAAAGGPSKALFKDKKLTRLWEKAEKAGLSDVELVALQEEFQHHQEKVFQDALLLVVLRAFFTHPRRIFIEQSFKCWWNVQWKSKESVASQQQYVNFLKMVLVGCLQSKINFSRLLFIAYFALYYICMHLHS